MFFWYLKILRTFLPVSTAIERKGDAYAATANQAKPNVDELSGLFAGHIAKVTLVLCDGLKSYHSFPAPC